MELEYYLSLIGRLYTQLDQAQIEYKKMADQLKKLQTDMGIKDQMIRSIQGNSYKGKVDERVGSTQSNNVTDSPNNR